VVIGLVGAVGTQLDRVRSLLEERLRVAGYTVKQIRISHDVIPDIAPVGKLPEGDEYSRIKAYMDAGNKARKESGDNAILALGTAAFINSQREKDEEGIPKNAPKRAYLVISLKHPEEVTQLREIYPEGFYLVGVHADGNRRLNYLTNDKRMTPENAHSLMERDKDEHLLYGQRLVDTFHLSDFFVHIDENEDQLKFSIWRLIDLIFGYPYVTPTFDEYAMFMAYSASLRSADMSRQVGAVVTVNDQVVGTGANDCPKAGGGLYWPVLNPQTNKIEDRIHGRDYMRGDDCNKLEQEKIVDEILRSATEVGIDCETLRSVLIESRIFDLTEFGRVVHAEMESLLSCSREHISVRGGTLYTTTFPCHNCAKHIVAAGILRVVFIEPYLKSKAAEFHTDSIQVGLAQTETGGEQRDMVKFQPFVGVGPRRFFDLFSMRLGSGYPLKRNDQGHVLDWKLEDGRLRLQMLPFSYLDLELVASKLFERAREKNKERENAK
jgi:deoxycytidylate deaminase